ncbi:portal protein, partial [Bacillus cereus]|uniref:portal protein n=1 Tax=Bacillus cereus TaxID=1396 RepID=UPI0034D5CC27
MEDVNYLLNKLFAALKIPKAFLGYEKDLTGKATLAAEDIRFARTVERIQRIVLSELTKIALV